MGINSETNNTIKCLFLNCPTRVKYADVRLAVQIFDNSESDTANMTSMVFLPPIDSIEG